MSNRFAGANKRVSYKKPKGRDLSKTKKARSKAHSKRISVENAFAHTKTGRVYLADMVTHHKNSMMTLPYVECTTCLGMKPTSIGRIKYSG